MNKPQASEEAQKVDFPVLKIVEKYIKAGGRIETRFDRICLVDENGEYLAGGKTFQELLENCIWTFC